MTGLFAHKDYFLQMYVKANKGFAPQVKVLEFACEDDMSISMLEKGKNKKDFKATSMLVSWPVMLFTLEKMRYDSKKIKNI